jgi:hypothetical protein
MGKESGPGGQASVLQDGEGAGLPIMGAEVVKVLQYAPLVGTRDKRSQGFLFCFNNVRVRAAKLGKKKRTGSM